MTGTHRRLGALAVLLAAVLGLAACSNAPSSPGVAHLGDTSASDGNANSAPIGATGTPASTASPKGNATGLVDEWAACERSHGDPNQADPIIDAYGVINVTIPRGASPAGNPHDASGTCSEYLAAAQKALRAADPVQDPQGPTTAQFLQYVGCMRANGVPNYPYPSGPDDSQTNFNGTGVDPNSPSVERVNDLCGKKLGLPSWWIAGTGPPGDISVSSAGVPGNAPACIYTKTGCPGNGSPKPIGTGGTSAGG